MGAYRADRSGEFGHVGHRQLCLLGRYCATHGRMALLCSDRAVVRRLVSLLDLANVRTETTV